MTTVIQILKGTELYTMIWGLKSHLHDCQQTRLHQIIEKGKFSGRKGGSVHTFYLSSKQKVWFQS